MSALGDPTRSARLPTAYLFKSLQHSNIPTGDKLEASLGMDLHKNMGLIKYDSHLLNLDMSGTVQVKCPNYIVLAKVHNNFSYPSLYASWTGASTAFIKKQNKNKTKQNKKTKQKSKFYF